MLKTDPHHFVEMNLFPIAKWSISPYCENFDLGVGTWINNGWINDEKLINSANKLIKSGYGNYLLSLLN